MVSSSVSAVIFGIALANLPFGFLADRSPVQPIIQKGGIMIAVAGLICAITTNICLGQEKANTFYVMLDYLGGWIGITMTGFVYQRGGWNAFVSISLLILVIPVIVSIKERTERIDRQ